MIDPSLDFRINAERFREDFDILSQIGATPEGGVHRPSFSESHLEARAWLRQRILEDGLSFRSDGAGNYSAFLECGPQNSPTLLLGSHLDSVISGGRFDGALGVTAALEVLRTVKEVDLRLPVNLEAIDFTDEEGTLVGLLGSRALAGLLKQKEFQSPRGGREALQNGLARARLSEQDLFDAQRNTASLAGYLELHIEQGPRLQKAGMTIGVVTAIVGICSYRLSFIGRADHSGTTPMTERLDAALGASSFILGVRQTTLEEFPDCVANVGALNLSPGAFNIVPERADLSLEFRSSDSSSYQRLEEVLIQLARTKAQDYGLRLEIEFLGKHFPTPMSSIAQQAIVQAADALGLAHTPLVSGAGHDAQSLAEMCPAGMIFVPSEGGASHSPREFTRWEDCVNGANVLLGAALRMAEIVGGRRTWKE